MQVEYGSATLTAELLHRMIVAGAPDPLLRVAHRIVTDELDHALLSHQALVAYGGPEEAVQVEPRLRRGPAGLDQLLPSILRTVLKTFCFGETLAVPLFAEMRRGAKGPSVAVLDRILRDEAVHSRFGWDSLGRLLELGDGDELRASIAAEAPRLISHFEGSCANRRADNLSQAEVEAGLLGGRDHKRVFRHGVDALIVPRLQSRRIDVQRAEA